MNREKRILSDGFLLFQATDHERLESGPEVAYVGATHDSVPRNLTMDIHSDYPVMAGDESASVVSILDAK